MSHTTASQLIPPTTDVLVLGAGVTGLLSAIALAKTGFSVCLAGNPEVVANGRTVALLDGSVQMMRNLDVWEALEAVAAPLKTMRIVDDTGSLFTIPPVDFSAREIGLEQFGFNVPLHRLTAILSGAARAMPRLTLSESRAETICFASDHAEVTMADGKKLASRLIVGADGRHSLARQSGRIGVQSWSYPQEALTAVMVHRQPHADVSTEFQTRSGPCTLVPMPQAEDGCHRSSLVWLMTPADAAERYDLEDRAFAMAVQKQIKFTLGAMQVEGARGKFPMSGMTARKCSAPRLALLGEAAHVFPPIGAQGLNLGLRDVADLVDCLVHHRAEGDAGAAPALAEFENLRRGDIAARSLFVDALNRSLLTPLLPVDFLRGAGLAALAHIGPLRRAVMRAGVRPQRMASLMRAAPRQRSDVSQSPA